MLLHTSLCLIFTWYVRTVDHPTLDLSDFPSLSSRSSVAPNPVPANRTYGKSPLFLDLVVWMGARLFPEACLVGARLVYFERWTEPVPQNLGQLCRWALLSHLIAEQSCYGHAAAAGSKLWQLSFTRPFPSAISPQSCTAEH